MFALLTQRGFQIKFLSHAEAILGVDFPEAVSELADALADLTIPISEIIKSGGGESKGTQRLRRKLDELGWRKLHFTIEKKINGKPRESISHEVDLPKLTMFVQMKRATSHLRLNGTIKIRFSSGTWKTLNVCMPRGPSVLV